MAREEQREERLPILRPFLNFPLLEEDLWGMNISSQSGLSISEDKDHVYVEAEMPGLKPENIEVTFEKGIVWIKGEKKEEEEDMKRKFYKRSSRSFSYRVQVPGLIDERREPEAKYKDGIMKISFKKSQETQSKKIPVKTA